MPVMTGLDVVAYVHREGVCRPIILVSGRLDTKIRQRAADLGVTRVMKKPFEADRLVDLIRTALLERN